MLSVLKSGNNTSLMMDLSMNSLGQMESSSNYWLGFLSLKQFCIYNFCLVIHTKEEEWLAFKKCT